MSLRAACMMILSSLFIPYSACLENSSKLLGFYGRDAIIIIWLER